MDDLTVSVRLDMSLKIIGDSLHVGSFSLWLISQIFCQDKVVTGIAEGCWRFLLPYPVNNHLGFA